MIAETDPRSSVACGNPGGAAVYDDDDSPPSICMATCPRCRGHLTDSHVCPSRPARTAAELIADAGASAAALGFLLRVIVSLGPRRRRDNARADAEERIQQAQARDAEDLVDRRIELRGIIMQRIRSGEIDLRPEDISESLLDKIAGAADRLADGGLSFDREQLPSGS